MLLGLSPGGLTFVSLLALAVPGQAAWADSRPDGPPQESLRLTSRRPGTHFLLELSGGLLTTHQLGPAFSALVGVGGKPPGLPLRFYAISEVSYADGDTGPLENSPTRDVRDERSYLDLKGGVRAYLPVLGPVRLFADVLLGATQVDARVERAGSLLGPLAAQGWKPLVALGGGAQVRLIRHLSVGLRSTVVLTEQDVGDLRAVSGQTRSLRTNVMAGLTCHF